MGEMGEARRDVPALLNQWADELETSKGTVVPGMAEMARGFAKVVEVQNDSLAENAVRGAALVQISDHWGEFVSAAGEVTNYLEPVAVAVAQVRESEKKTDG